MKKGFKSLYIYLIHRFKGYKKKIFKIQSNLFLFIIFLERKLKKIVREWQKVCLRESIQMDEKALDFQL